MVSVTVFTVVVGVGTGAFIVMIKSQRHILGAVAVQGDASVVMELMAKEIRTGKSFQILNPISGAPGQHGTTLRFINYKDETIEYNYDSGSYAVTKSINGGTAQRLTSVKVKITSLRFVLQNSGADSKQPLVSIMAVFESTGQRVEQIVTSAIETSISIRELEN